MKEVTDEVIRKLCDEKRLLVGGFNIFRTAVIHPEASDTQIREMSMAFHAGASFLFEAIMLLLDPSAEPTETDLDRMSNINEELAEFGEGFKEFLKKKGHH
jgi:hypothetical protein